MIIDSSLLVDECFDIFGDGDNSTGGGKGCAWEVCGVAVFGVTYITCQFLSLMCQGRFPDWLHSVDALSTRGSLSARFLKGGSKRELASEIGVKVRG
jgi:hypothetical protein